jgi:hypothetical protein
MGVGVIVLPLLDFLLDVDLGGGERMASGDEVGASFDKEEYEEENDDDSRGADVFGFGRCAHRG